MELFPGIGEADVVPEDELEGDEGAVEDDMACDEVARGDPCDDAPPFDEDVEQDAAPQPELVAAMEAASDALLGVEGNGASSSSSAAPPPNYVVDQSSSDGLLTISSMGYVRCRRPGFVHPTATIGLIVLYADGKTLCASCHLHPRCAIKVSLVQKSVSDLRLAEWLAVGAIPTPGQSRDQKLALGAEHRKRWCREGPFPDK